MSSIPTKQIDGDVAVGRNVAAGGDANIQGSARVGHDLTVEGWLNAKNIKGPDKGLYSSAEKLKSMCPHPKDGDYALVGETLPAALYIVENGKWKDSGETAGEPIIEDIDLSEITEIAEQAGAVAKGTVLLSKLQGEEYDEIALGAEPDGVYSVLPGENLQPVGLLIYYTSSYYSDIEIYLGYGGLTGAGVQTGNSGVWVSWRQHPHNGEKWGAWKCMTLDAMLGKQDALKPGADTYIDENSVKLTGAGREWLFRQIWIKKLGGSTMTVQDDSGQTQYSYMHPELEGMIMDFDQAMEFYSKLPSAELIAAWNRAFTVGTDVYGQFNYKTMFFEGNGLTDITTEQAVAILQAGTPTPGNVREFYTGQSDIRTNVPVKVFVGYSDSSLSGRFFSGCRNLEIVRPGYIPLGRDMFISCVKLRYIAGTLVIANNLANIYAFKGCGNVENIVDFQFILYPTEQNPAFFTDFTLDFRALKVLPTATVGKLATAYKNAANRQLVNMTLKLHQDVYASLLPEEIEAYTQQCGITLATS